MTSARNASLPLSVAMKLDAVCDTFEEAWVRGERPRIEDYLAGQSEPLRSALLGGLIEIELDYRARAAENPTQSEYLSRFSDDPDLIADIFHQGVIRDKDRADAVRSDSDAGQDRFEASADLNGERIGRHLVIRQLGSGGFGTVYLAHDEELRRPVAIKIPRRSRISRAEDVEAYLGEARVVASLDHPHIVPVYDVGRTEDGLCYIVSKYIEGQSLRDLISHERPSHMRAAELIAMVASALHYAHTQGVIHRDIKPSNILIDSGGKPHVADFGLALKDDQFAAEDLYVGAPAYMSPEQARGEGHLVDGRSDIFSLGVVFYELLTGVRPFRGSGWREVLERVKTLEARPPRQLDPAIPQDLERICLKALSKRAADRYSTASDMAEDLQGFLNARYQLTHDSFVPSLREWLTRRRRETRRRQAELCLQDRALLWHAKPDNRYLPAWWEFVHIRCLLNKKDWTQPQRHMMRRAARYHTMRSLLVLLVVGVAAAVGWGILSPWQNANHAAGLVERLLDARITEVPGIVVELGPYQRWAHPAFERTFSTSSDPGHRLRAGLALVAARGDAVVDDLVQRMLEAGPDELPVIRDALENYKSRLTDKLWASVEDHQTHLDQRFRAACALATYAPKETRRWEKASTLVADQLVSVSPVFADRWIAMLRPVRHSLLPELGAIFRDARRPEHERHLAAQVLADYAGDQVDALIKLLVDSDAHQFAALFGRLEQYRHMDHAIALLEAVLQDEQMARQESEQRLAKQKAVAAVALLRIDPTNQLAWSVMRHSPDPRVRTYLVHELAPYGVDAETVAAQLEAQEDPSIRRALILSLGQFAPDQLPSTEKQKLLMTLHAMYRNDDDRGIHAAAEWLLRRWGQEDQIKRIDEEMATGEAQGDRQWYINGQGHTMVILDADQFQMGSPKSEDYRLLAEAQHTREIGRKFAMASKEVTRRQFEIFRQETGASVNSVHEFSPHPDGPQVSLNWYLAAHYCNWLSQQEGIPKAEWCYEPNEAGQYAAGMRPAVGCLERRGYRLPTEAEWELACRAGVATSRYYGDADELLTHYAWYDGNSGQCVHPVGQLMPNDFGLFDMHGNVWEWTNSRYEDYPQQSGTDPEDRTATEDLGVRILRGGAWGSPVKVVRSATRYVSLISATNAAHGFRVAGTVARHP